jgi:hypothetical protein
MNNEPELFEYDWGEDNSQEDNTEITTTILYFSKDELVKFKTLCKTGIRQMFGEQANDKGNLSDFLLNTLNNLYGNNKTD